MDFVKKILNAKLGKTHLFFVGQAGFIVKSASGQLLAIDLYLSECVERVEGHIGFKRLLPQILLPQDLEFDCIVATHSHYDHFDKDAIPELLANGRTRLYASLNCKQEMINLRANDSRAKYVKPGDVIVDGDFTLEFVTCDHGEGAPDAVGVVVTVDGKKIYEAGDTCLRVDRVQEYADKGPLDVLIAPINGAYGNLSERDCAVLSEALKPVVTIPCHYGMFASHGGNVGLFYDIMKKEYPDNSIILMAQGEGIIL